MGLLTTGAVDGNALGTLLARALNLLRQNNVPAITTLLEQDSPGPIRSNKTSASGPALAYYLAQLDAGVVVVLISGIESLEHGIALYNGYVPSFTQQAGQVNTWAASQAAEIQRQLQLLGWWGMTSSFVVAGHSGGGMVAPLLADAFKAAYPTYRVCWHTYGAPRLSKHSVAVVGERTPGARWMWHADPVPLLPLRFSDGPWLVPIIGIQGLIQAGYYTHWRGGWMLLPDEVGHPEELPVTAAVSPFVNVASWLVQITNNPASGHNIHEYEAFMQAEYTLLRNANVNPARQEPVEVPENLQRLPMTRAERELAVNITNAEHRQNATPVSIPTAQVWRAVRVGRIHLVMLGDHQVAVAGSKKAARGLARLMNESFRRLQRTAVVDPAALTTGLDDYLQAASDPAGAFRPVMNTTF